jgi:hypothetical protein
MMICLGCRQEFVLPPQEQTWGAETDPQPPPERQESETPAPDPVGPEAAAVALPEGEAAAGGPPPPQEEKGDEAPPPGPADSSAPAEEAAPTVPDAADVALQAQRRRRRWACALLLLAGLLAWRWWPRQAPEAAPPAPAWPSPLDLLERGHLKDADWPPDRRPDEAVVVLDLSGDGRLEVSVTVKGVFIKTARGDEVAHIDYDRGAWTEHHTALKAFLSLNADRLVVLGTSRRSGPDENVGRWAQVWRWEGSTLTPLEAQPLEDLGGWTAAFSLDGRLLATSSKDGVELWEVGDKGLKHLGRIADALQPLVFAPDGRSLAVRGPRSSALYDLGPILPGGSGWARWRFLWIALGMAVALAVLGPILAAKEAGAFARARGRLPLVVRVAFSGVGACVAWWALRLGPSGAPLTVGLGFGAAAATLILPARSAGRNSHEEDDYFWRIGAPPRGRGLPKGVVASPRSLRITKGVIAAAAIGLLVCLALWAWQFWWPSPSLLTPSRSDLAGTDVKAACFSADGRELAVVRADGRLSLFDAATGKETRSWDMPPGVVRPEYAADGRHLLAIAEEMPTESAADGRPLPAVARRKAYVLRLRPFDDDAFVLCCAEKVLARDPKSAEALLARGHVRLRKGELDEAIADFTEAIALNNTNAAAFLARGLARTDRGDYARAKEDFAAAVLIDPKLADRRPPP